MLNAWVQSEEDGRVGRDEKEGALGWSAQSHLPGLLHGPNSGPHVHSLVSRPRTSPPPKPFTY